MGASAGASTTSASWQATPTRSPWWTRNPTSAATTVRAKVEQYQADRDPPPSSTTGRRRAKRLRRQGQAQRLRDMRTPSGARSALRKGSCNGCCSAPRASETIPSLSASARVTSCRCAPRPGFVSGSSPTSAPTGCGRCATSPSASRALPASSCAPDTAARSETGRSPTPRPARPAASASPTSTPPRSNARPPTARERALAQGRGAAAARQERARRPLLQDPQAGRGPRRPDPRLPTSKELISTTTATRNGKPTLDLDARPRRDRRRRPDRRALRAGDQPPRQPA